MLVKARCPKCRRRIYVLKLVEGAVARCPRCGTQLELQGDESVRKKAGLDGLVETLPLTDIGSRERPFYLEEKELVLFARQILDSISKIREWSERSREQLEREAQELKGLIAYLEEKGRDPLLRKMEFLMLSSFIKNYYG
jgi:hypothetical protein